MRTIDVIQGQSNRNQSLRLLMLLIIVGTFPFYCFAIYIIGSAPVELAAAKIAETEAAPAPSFTPLGADLFASPLATANQPLIPTNTPLSLLQPTPAQFVPPTPIPAQTIVAQTIVSPSPAATETATIPAATDVGGIADGDFDGITDDEDSCPEQYGYVDNEGCPYPDDIDLDGIRDDADVCPREFAPGSPRGCRDFDDDGLDTAADECPDVAGPSANQGCPLEAVAGG